MIQSLIVVLLLTSSPVLGVQWEIIGQGSKEPVYRGVTEVDITKSIGDASVRILEENRIPYVGTAAGINSILNSPTGDAAIVVVSDDTMRVYGWCFEVDGVQPSLMPNEYYFPSQQSTLRWFFAFALYENGEWKDYCVPAYTKPLVSE